LSRELHHLVFCILGGKLPKLRVLH